MLRSRRTGTFWGALATVAKAQVATATRQEEIDRHAQMAVSILAVQHAVTVCAATVRAGAVSLAI